MAEITPIPLAPVDALAVTILVDNVTDILLLDDGPAYVHHSGLVRASGHPSKMGKPSTRCAQSTASQR